MFKVNVVGYSTTLGKPYATENVQLHPDIFLPTSNEVALVGSGNVGV